VPAPRGRAAALVAVLALVLTGCGLLSTNRADPGPSLSPSPVEPTGSSPTQATSPSLARYYGQRLDWKPCRDEEQCARLTVPLDYAKPDGRTIELAVLKVPAADRSRRLGSLVMNPGGPGVSGVDFVASGRGAYFGDEVRRVFDVVGFDPRGVGHSTPLHCASDEQLDTLVQSDPDPDTPAEIRYADGLLRSLGGGCLDRSGDLARHMSTLEVAKDLDVLRAALGDRKLVYFGASYGTFIGATYADLFPKRVGRMVLDGALDPSSSTIQLNLVQARGFEVALRAYVRACVERGGCFLGSTVDQGAARIRSFLDEVEAKPLNTSGERDLTAGTASYGIWQPLYDKRSWPILDEALRRAFAGDGSVLLALADSYVERGPRGYLNNSLEALYAVNCLDHPDSIPSAQVAKYLPRFEKVSPTFGASFAYTLSACSSWPVKTGRVPRALHAAGAAPIMVVGTTRDPATPLTWAQALAKQLSSGVLVKRDGDGHTGYRSGNSCVDTTVESYLVAGKVPPREVDC
jgi:pimeloyl-ACP methyl ester carboxylesterase